MTRPEQNRGSLNASSMSSAKASHLGRVIGAVMVALALTALPSLPADAHAQVERTTPVANERVVGRVPSIVFRYSENVTLVEGSLRLTGPGSQMRTLTPVGSGPAPAVEVVPGGLADGAYVAQVEVISEDGHHVSTAIAFTVEGSGVVTTSSIAVPSTKASKGSTTKTPKTTKRKAGAVATTTVEPSVPKPSDVAITGEGIVGAVRLTPIGRPYRYRVDVTARSTAIISGTLANLTLRMAVPNRSVPAIDIPIVATAGATTNATVNATANDVVIPALGSLELSVGATVGQFDAFTGIGTFQVG